jgi:hypothetical protein
MRYIIAVVALGLLPVVGKPAAEISMWEAGNRSPSLEAQDREPFDQPAPAIAIVREGDRVKITFTGALESAEAIGGPWSEIPSAVSPFSQDLAGSRRFYRSRGSGAGSIFSTRAVAVLTVEGPLQKHFELAFAGQPDGIFPPVREKPYFDGTLHLGGFELPVSLRVRGNSSLQECPFPKLKFKVSREDRPGTPFVDAREVKIGTHCAEGGQGTVGRLRDQRAAFREALAYETMELLGFVGPRVRRARIDYRDTTPANEASTAGWEVSRNAVILDDIEVVAERLGARALDDEEISALTNAGLDEQLITDLQFLHALLGNWDYELSQDGQGLWNTDVIELVDGRLVPVAGDFDLASFVTGAVRLSVPHDYHPDLGDVERQARYEIEQIRGRVGAQSFLAAVERFTSKRAAIEGQAGAAEIDEEGRANALRHIIAFFEGLESVGDRDEFGKANGY